MNDEFCHDCPDREACSQGMPCEVVREVQKMSDDEKKADDSMNSGKDYAWGGIVRGDSIDSAKDYCDWPGDLNTSGLLDEDASFLSIEQEQRVSALHHARGLLEKRSQAGFGSTPSVTPPNLPDLFAVAHYILTGEVAMFGEGS